MKFPEDACRFIITVMEGIQTQVPLFQASVISAHPQSCDFEVRFNIIVQCTFVLSEWYLQFVN